MPRQLAFHVVENDGSERPLDISKADSKLLQRAGATEVKRVNELLQEKPFREKGLTVKHKPRFRHGNDLLQRDAAFSNRSLDVNVVPSGPPSPQRIGLQRRYVEDISAKLAL
ncbi:MAG: hypothetical protein ACP5VR_09820 [Acidimicrobiales bacterium]